MFFFVLSDPFGVVIAVVVIVVIVVAVVVIVVAVVVIVVAVVVIVVSVVVVVFVVVHLQRDRFRLLASVLAGRRSSLERGAPLLQTGFSLEHCDALV